MKNLKSIIETILFVYGEPISLTKLAKTAKAPEEEIKQALEELEKDCLERGLAILWKEDQYQLATNPDNKEYAEDLLKGELGEDLSKAALETIAIVAYKGPLTRVQIEYIRGVNCSFILRNLLMRGLVERIDNPKDSRSYLYKISFDFLKHFGITKIEDLPGFEELRKHKIEILEDGK